MVWKMGKNKKSELFGLEIYHRRKVKTLVSRSKPDGRRGRLSYKQEVSGGGKIEIQLSGKKAR